MEIGLGFSNKKHKHHAKGGSESREPTARGLIRVLNEVRLAQRDLIIMAYNGFTTEFDRLFKWTTQERLMQFHHGGNLFLNMFIVEILALAKYRP